MLSIIICSRTADISKELKDNIASTVGCEYELCVIDNSHNEYSIFTAYNEGVRRAKGDILCFVHDDVLFQTENWGVIPQKLLSKPQVGVVGVGGSHFLPSVPMYWSDSPFVSDYVVNNDHGTRTESFKCDYFDKDGISETVVCDGVFLAFNASVFTKISFDATYYSGFHAYDMDICMQIQAHGLKCIVTNQILLEHAWSDGDMNTKNGMDKFGYNLELFTAKWSHELPIWRGGPDLPEYVRNRINRLCIQAYDAKKARRSVAYRLGRTILMPMNAIRRIFIKANQ